MKHAMFASASSHKGRRLILTLVLLLLVIGAAAVFLLARLRPMIRPIAVARAKTMATRAINAAVDQVLAMDSISYESLILLQMDSENRVTALKTNTALINKLKAELFSVFNLYKILISLYS